MRGAALSLACVSGLLLLGCNGQPDPAPLDETAIAARSQPIAAEFQSALQAQLQEALASGGPQAAVGVCQQAAPAIAAMQSEASGAEVSRVARLHRNPQGGVPETMLAQYDALAAQPVIGDKPASTIWQSGSGESAQVHFMSAIPMQDQPCSVCHGTQIDPELKAYIDTLYPDDAATGFEAGDMRGALLISWPAAEFGE